MQPVDVGVQTESEQLGVVGQVCFVVHEIRDDEIVARVVEALLRLDGAIEWTRVEVEVGLDISFLQEENAGEEKTVEERDEKKTQENGEKNLEQLTSCRCFIHERL